MNGIILAAGRGTRLNQISDFLPKPLLPVLGRPVLDYVLGSMFDADVEKVIINAFHLKYMLTGYIGRRGRDERILVSEEDELLGTGGGISLAIRRIGNGTDFIIHNSDILTNADIRSLLNFHSNAGSIATLMLHDYSCYNKVLVSENGKIVDFEGRRRIRASNGDRLLAFTGISVVNRKLLDFLPEPGKAGSIIDAYLEVLKSARPLISGYVISGHYWLDIGTKESYIKLHRDILCERKFLPAQIPGKLPDQISESVFTDGEVEIADHVKFSGFVYLGKNSKIGKNSEICNSVVWENGIVPPGAKLIGAVVTPYGIF